MLRVVCGMLMSFVGCCVGLRFVPFVAVRGWLLFGIRCGCCALRVFGAVGCMLMSLCWLLFLPVVCCPRLLLFDIWCL